jgi:NAD-dependent dihydropyrimidine dehydrogenase PreA subunit
MHTPKYLRNVTTLQLDQDKCTGCGLCLQVCPHGVLKMNHKKAGIVDRDSCMECGACARNCAFGAITVRAGVGCAWAIYYGKFHKTETSCPCSEQDCCC